MVLCEVFRFWSIRNMDERHIKDAQKWLDEENLVALVDEKKGGIIGYINRTHIDEILPILNKELDLK